MHNIKKSWVKTAGLVSTLAILGACASAPKPVESLDQANAAYSRANTDPLVNQHASRELNEASDWVRRANELMKEGAERSVVEHHAYLASQRVKIAEFRAVKRATDTEIQRVNLEHQQAQVAFKTEKAEETVREAEALRYQLLELEAKNSPRGLVMTLADDLFQPGNAVMTQGAFNQISRISNFMSQHPSKRIEVEGHTDSAGDDDFNFDLSVARASAVRAALMQRGIDGTRIKAKGFGEESPIAENNSYASRMLNRRVEVIFPGEKVSEAADR